MQSGLFLSRFPTKILYAHLIAPCVLLGSGHVIYLDSIMVINVMRRIRENVTQIEGQCAVMQRQLLLLRCCAGTLRYGSSTLNNVFEAVHCK